MKYMLDTNICIYVQKNKHPKVLKQFRENFSQICISAVTYAELAVGVEKSEQKEKNSIALHDFTKFLNVVPFDIEAAKEYGTIRVELEKSGKVIGNNDMMIAASAKVHNMILVTNNVREFERVSGLRLENWI